MESIISLIYFIVVMLTLSLLLPFIFWLINVVEKTKLTKTDNIDKLKERAIKLIRVNLIFSQISNLTINEVAEKLINKKELINKRLMPALTIGLSLLIFSFYMSMISNLLMYYAKVEQNHIIPLTFPLAEVIRFAALSLWIGTYLLTKLSIYKIDMYLNKIKGFLDNETQN